MRILESKIGGSGNGVHTKINNLGEVGADLRREPSHLLKFFSLELGTIMRNMKLGVKKTSQVNYILNGKFTSERLSEVLDSLIDKYVLCGTCGNPETEFKLKKNVIFLECQSCGHQTKADNQHKFADFLLREFKGATDGVNQNSSQITDGVDDPAYLFQSATDSKSIEDRKRLPRLTSTKSNEHHGDVADKLWGGSELVEAAFLVSLESQQPISNELLYAFRNKLMLTPDELTKHLFSICLRHDFIRQFLPFIRRFKKYFSWPRYQRSLLSCLLERIVQPQPELLNQLPTILIVLYDHDCLDVASLYNYYNDLDITNDGSQQVKITLAPVIHWLQN